MRFVPPGNWLNPYRLGTAVTLDGGWRVKVNSATIDATAAVEAVVDPGTGDHPNPAPAPGEQYTLVNISLKYVDIGAGPGLVSYFLFQISQLGAQGNVSGLYPPDSCEPPGNDLGTAGTLRLGDTLRGNLCYEIGSRDARSLRLMGLAPVGSPQGIVWFALR